MKVEILLAAMQSLQDAGRWESVVCEFYQRLFLRQVEAVGVDNL